MSVPSESQTSIIQRSDMGPFLFSDSANQYCASSSARLISHLNKNASKIPRIADAFEDQHFEELCEERFLSTLDQELSEPQIDDCSPRLRPTISPISPKSLGISADDEMELEFSRWEADNSIKAEGGAFISSRKRLESTLSPKRTQKGGPTSKTSDHQSFRFELISIPHVDAEPSTEWHSVGGLSENDSNRAIIPDGFHPQKIRVTGSSNRQLSWFGPKPILKKSNPRTQQGSSTVISSPGISLPYQSGKNLTKRRSSLSPKKRVTWSKMSMVFVYHEES